MTDVLTYRTLPLGTPRHWMFVLHGLGDSLESWMSIAPELGLDDIGIIGVNAPTPYYSGYQWFSIPGMTVDQMSMDEWEAEVAHSRRCFAATVAHCQKTYDFTAAQTFLLGFSQGCMMVTDHAWRHDQRYAGVIGISGRLLQVDAYPEAFGAVGLQQDILLTHGTEDTVIDIRSTDGERKQMQALGARLDWRVYAKAHSVAPDEFREIHAWISERRRAPSLS